jgi:invasion protein IalB
LLAADATAPIRDDFMQSLNVKPFLAAFFAGLSLTGAAMAQSENADTLWQTRCAGTSRTADALVCEASQSLRVKESGQLLFKVDVITPADKGAAVLQLQAPLGFYLPGKIRLAVDGTALTELEVGTCDQRGCFLSAEATPAMIDAMKAGNSLQIDFAPAAGRRQAVEVPLTGFTRAMDAIR